jgi:2-phosphosulfolactate phosphatase
MYERYLQVHNLPKDVDEAALVGRTAIVIDVLRATTTICQALASGAREVVPFRRIDETLAAAAKVGRDQIVLGGERGGKRIEGFDLGNSPAEYTPESVGGRTVFITTTNGTQALYHARIARRVLIGAFVNLSAVVASVKNEHRIDILCAGTDGRETSEDILLAGGIVDRLCRKSAANWQLNHAAAMAGRDWSLLRAKAQRANRSIIEQLMFQLPDTPGGRNLVEVGLDRDLADCAQIDRLHVVPELDVQSWRITVR